MLVGSSSISFWPFSMQHGFSMSVWTKGSNYVAKLSASCLALSQYFVTWNFLKNIRNLIGHQMIKVLLNLIGKTLANKLSKTASKLTSYKRRNNHELTSHLRVQFSKTLVLSTLCSWVAPRYLFDHFPGNMVSAWAFEQRGQIMSQNFWQVFWLSVNISWHEIFQKYIRNLIGKRLANKLSKTASKLNS